MTEGQWVFKQLNLQCRKIVVVIVVIMENEDKVLLVFLQKQVEGNIVTEGSQQMTDRKVKRITGVGFKRFVKEHHGGKDV